MFSRERMRMTIDDGILVHSVSLGVIKKEGF
jgi:hypothetical protein